MDLGMWESQRLSQTLFRSCLQSPLRTSVCLRPNIRFPVRLVGMVTGTRTEADG